MTLDVPPSAKREWCWFNFHDWSKWSEPRQASVSTYLHGVLIAEGRKCIVQDRRCRCCNAEDSRELNVR